MTICATCGLVPGVIKIGHYEDDGEALVFIFERWECGFCASQTCAIEHT